MHSRSRRWFLGGLGSAIAIDLAIDSPSKAIAPTPNTQATPAPATITITKAAYRGWADAWQLRNHQIEAWVVPAIGRVIQFRLHNGEDLFWENEQLHGQFPQPQAEEWVNFGGDKVWPAPQADWPNMTGRAWPPPAGFDATAMTVTVQKTGIQLTSGIDPFYGVQIDRQIAIDPNRPVMRITTTYSKRQGEPTTLSIWTVTQLRSPLIMYAPLPAQSQFPLGYISLSDELPADLQIQNQLLSLTRSPNHSHKIGLESRELLWVGQETMVHIATPKLQSGTYPDGGSSAEIYTNPDPAAYVELELLSPLQQLRMGEQMTFVSTYTLIPRSHPNPEQDARSVFAQLSPP